MRLAQIFLALWLFGSTQLYSQADFAAAMDAYVFSTEENGYVEIFLKMQTDSTSVADSISARSFKVTVLLNQGDSTIVADKYLLDSPTNGEHSFFDIKRYALSAGQYKAMINLLDPNQADQPVTLQNEFTIPIHSSDFFASDITFIEAYWPNDDSNMAKNGYMLEYKLGNQFANDAKSIQFYQELYHADATFQEDFLLHYTITKKDQATPEYESYQRQKPSSNIILLNRLDISNIEEGSYTFSIECMDRHKKLIWKKSKTFHKLPPTFEAFVENMDVLDLKYALKALAVTRERYNGEDYNEVIAKGSYVRQKEFIYKEWKKLQPTYTLGAYRQYMNLAKGVDDLYKSGFGYGFESARGYTHMNYGPPNNILSEEQDPMAPPYEIWTYYDFPKTQQSNVKFVFYNPDLAGSNYVMLHSTAIGETNNPRWLNILYEKDTNDRASENFLEGGNVSDSYYRNAERNFKDN